MKKWELEAKLKSVKINDVIKLLLANRGIKTKTEIENFLHPTLKNVTISSVRINKTQLKKALVRINQAIKKKQKIVIFGDYDVDGICGTAILWESLNSLGANVMPYIPSRFEEGYGLSEKGIENLLQKDKVDLIITVDNGIVANAAVEFAKKKGVDVIITDHHLPSKSLPKALAIVHTTLLCGAGVAYLLSQQFKTRNHDHLELVALATVADLVPLTNTNRVLVYFGLKALHETKRIGLLTLIQKSGLTKEEIDTYEVGHMLAPRLNAMGRLASAMDSLRLICTNDRKKAEKLAELLNQTNLERQQLTLSALEHAKNKAAKTASRNLIFLADESYQQGIVGLVAGRMVEEFYLPSIIISKGKKYSRASARSVKGFNIVEFLRTASDLMEDVGGHPMAAGFTIETAKLELLEKRLYATAQKLLKKEHLERILRIDLELPAEFINYETYLEIRQLAPFGMANPEPTFLSRSLTIQNVRLVGKEGKHLKIGLRAKNSGAMISGIAFGMGDKNELKIGDNVDVVYTLESNNWRDNKNVELKIKDIKS
jgi:single-stranded-DNA-specific exonuclease